VEFEVELESKRDETTKLTRLPPLIFLLLLAFFSCRLNCEYVWPTNFITGMELDTPEYWGRIKGDLIVEKQLAMGGSEFSLFLSLFLSLSLSLSLLIRHALQLPLVWLAG